MKIISFLITIIILSVTYSSQSQIISPAGESTRASSQMVYYYDQLGGNSDIQITNTNPSSEIWIHVQFFMSFLLNNTVVNCDERNFVDLLTPNDTHVYDLSRASFPKNIGEASGQEGDSASVSVSSTKGFVVITPIVSEADFTAISFQHLIGVSKGNSPELDFIISAVGRDAVDFTTGEILPDGTPLNGNTNGFVLIQPQELIFDFDFHSIDSEAVDVVGIVFSDDYGPEGLLGYKVKAGDSRLGTFIFDFKEDPTSCGSRDVECFITTGLNQTLTQNNIGLAVNPPDLLCSGAESPPQPGLGIPTGWVRIFVQGLDDLENQFGVFYNNSLPGADLMYAKGPTTVIEPPEEEICGSGEDEDGDGLVDCDDPDCDKDPFCENDETECANGEDDDSDGKIDCLDEGCDNVGTCEFGIELTCDDDIDNDGDEFTDCDDTDCEEDEACIDIGGGGCTVAGLDSSGSAIANFVFTLTGLFVARKVLSRKRK